MENRKRITVSIDEALLADYKQLAARSHRSLGAVIQDALREALLRRDEAAGTAPVKLPTFHGGGSLPGVDLDDNVATRRLLEEERDEELRRSMRGDR